MLRGMTGAHGSVEARAPSKWPRGGSFPYVERNFEIFFRTSLTVAKAVDLTDLRSGTDSPKLEGNIRGLRDARDGNPAFPAEIREP
jgi:hypothetical protein